MHRKLKLLRGVLAAFILVAAAFQARPDGAAAAGPGADSAVPAAPPHFGYGVNFGWTDGWTDAGFAAIAARAGATTARVKLPEYYLDQWGYSIAFENGAMPAYAANGLTNLTATLIGPTAAHSNSPPGGDLDRYSPRNLYEPIWSSPGVINPGNYWAAYVAQAVAQYKGQVRIWEVWNEPDTTANWEATQGAWWTSPPQAADLPGWNDTIFSYIRLLRVTYEVAKSIDPNCFVAIGGIGYESFLDATLRYTDNPADGSVQAEYPAGGGAWFDAVSFHHYPQFATLDQASQTWLRGTDSDAMATSFLVAQNNLRLRLDHWGYDGTAHPRKLWLSTETGVSSKAIGGFAGGVELQRNYLLKMSILAQAGGLAQAHWFQLADTEADGAASDSYAHMGLYYDLRGQSPGSAALKPSAQAYATVGSFLRDQDYDAAATAGLALPGNVRGSVFRLADGRKTYALWATTAGNSEAAAASLQLPTAVPLVERLWDFAATQSTSVLAPANGGVALALSGTPVFLTETTPSGPPQGPAAPGTTFPDVPPSHPYYQAITQLSQRGIIRGYQDGRFGPGDTILRAQMAALICRAMGWEAEDRGNPFPDRDAVDDSLWRNVGTLASYNIARGFPDGHYGPTEAVLEVQTISFIARAMVRKGVWQLVTTDNPALYPNVSADSGHRLDVLTYYAYVGTIPGTEPSANWASWAQPATRGWFAQVLWQALYQMK